MIKGILLLNVLTTLTIMFFKGLGSVNSSLQRFLQNVTKQKQVSGTFLIFLDSSFSVNLWEKGGIE